MTHTGGIRRDVGLGNRPQVMAALTKQPLHDLVAAASIFEDDRGAGLLIRWPVALLTCWNAMRSAVEHVACSAIGQETSASLR